MMEGALRTAALRIRIPPRACRSGCRARQIEGRSRGHSLRSHTDTQRGAQLHASIFARGILRRKSSQRWRPDFDRGLYRLAVGRVIHSDAVYEAFRVVRFVQIQSRANGPSVEVQRQRYLGTEVETPQQAAGMKARLAA